MARKQYIVGPDGSDWQIKLDGRRVSTHGTQAEATRVLIQRPDGTFRTEWTYGHDTYPPLG